MKPVLILTNCDSSAEAQRIADTLLARGFAAAVQILGPVNSRYRWKNEIHQKQEWVMMIKTNDQRQDDIRSTLQELHSYELPSMLSIAIDDGDSQYLRWILGASGDSGQPAQFEDHR